MMKIDWHLLEEKILDKTSRNFWLLFGPFCLLAAFLLLHCRSSLSLSLLSAASFIGYYLSWKFSFKGFSLSLFFMVGAILCISLLSTTTFGIWQLLWALSLCITLCIVTLSSGEYEKAKLRDEESHEKQLNEINELHKKELDGFSDLCDMHLSENRELKSKLDLLGDKIHAYKQFSLANKEESDKYFSESEQLSEKINSLQIELAKYQEEAFDGRVKERLVKKQRKLLNELRPQRYQDKILLEDYRKKEANSNQTKLENTSSFDYTENIAKLRALEEERDALRSSYSEKMRSYEAIKEKFKTFFMMDEMLSFQDPNSSFETTYNELKMKFESLGQSLSELRFETFKIEGQILEIKKELKTPDEEGGTLQSYLTIADQECLRLEKENKVLLELLSQSLVFANKRSSKDT